jgi:hypothetical protein
LQIVGPAAAATRVMTTPDANFTAARTDAAQSFTGDQTLSTGNLVIGTSGKGIDFSATPGTGTSELLNDYEEGTFTPVINGTSPVGTATYAAQLGRYTKIGRQVSFQIVLDWSAGGGAGSLRIGNLPYLSASGLESSIAIGIIDNVALAVATYASAFVRANSVEISLRQYPVGGGSSTDVAYDASGVLVVAGFYTV